MDLFDKGQRPQRQHSRIGGNALASVEGVKRVSYKGGGARIEIQLPNGEGGWARAGERGTWRGPRGGRVGVSARGTAVRTADRNATGVSPQGQANSRRSGGRGMNRRDSERAIRDALARGSITPAEARRAVRGTVAEGMTIPGGRTRKATAKKATNTAKAPRKTAKAAAKRTPAKKTTAKKATPVRPVKKRTAKKRA